MVDKQQIAGYDIDRTREKQIFLKSDLNVSIPTG